MNPITQFDRPVLRKIEADVLKAVEQVAEKYGVSLSPAGGNFSTSEFTVKVKFTVKSSDGSPTGKFADTFRDWHSSLRLEADDLGREFTAKGRTYRIVGANIGRKFPVLATRDDGKDFWFPVNAVRHALGRKEEGV